MSGEGLDPEFPAFWGSQPKDKTDADSQLFSEENLFAVEPEAPDEWNYDSASPEVREVVDLISEAVEWLEGEQGAGSAHFSRRSGGGTGANPSLPRDVTCPREDCRRSKRP